MVIFIVGSCHFWAEEFTIRSVLSLQFLANVLIEGVIHGKLAGKAFLIADFGCREPMSDNGQSDTFGRNVLLSFDICSPDDHFILCEIFSSSRPTISKCGLILAGP
jgi:hypothetical protein